MNSNFDDFLLKYYFISYLNCVLLKDIGNFTDNEVIVDLMILKMLMSNLLVKLFQKTYVCFSLMS